MTNHWIDIAEYATKYKISQSTLRRRIRNQSIQFKMERGKYYLEDSRETFEAAPLFSRHKVLQSIAGNKTQNTSPRIANQASNGTQRSADGEFFDPVDNFLSSSDVIPVYMQEEFNKLRTENQSLKRTVAEQETLIKALEAELGLPT